MASAASIAQDRTVLKGIWNSMKQRCFNENDAGYAYYGAKGVIVCERWLNFENFAKDVGPRPSPEYSIDRYPDPAGNYEPGNTRWATDKEQGRNKRNTVFITGGALAIDISAKLGIHRSHLSMILRGKRLPSYQVGKALAKTLGITMDELDRRMREYKTLEEWKYEKQG